MSNPPLRSYEESEISYLENPDSESLLIIDEYLKMIKYIIINKP